MSGSKNGAPFDVCGDGARDKRTIPTGVKRTILRSLRVVLIVPRFKAYRVPFTLVVIRLVETDDVIAQLWRDEVIAPIVDHGIVDRDVTVEVVMMNKVS
jgi:hypothetical protein